MEITSLEKCWGISDIVQEVSTPSCLLLSPYHLLTLPQAWHHHSQWSSTHEKPHYVVGLNPSRDPWPEMGCGPGNSLDKCQLGHVAGICLPCWQSSPVPSPGRGALVIVSSSHKAVLELLWFPPFSWVGAMGIAWSPPQWIDSTRALWVVPAGRLGPWRQSSVTTPGWQPENCDGRGSTLCPQARRVDVFQASSSRQQPMRPGRGSNVRRSNRKRLRTMMFKVRQEQRLIQNWILPSWHKDGYSGTLLGYLSSSCFHPSSGFLIEKRRDGTAFQKLPHSCRRPDSAHFYISHVTFNSVLGVSLKIKGIPTEWE